MWSGELRDYFDDRYSLTRDRSCCGGYSGTTEKARTSPKPNPQNIHKTILARGTTGPFRSFTHCCMRHREKEATRTAVCESTTCIGEPNGSDCITLTDGLV